MSSIKPVEQPPMILGNQVSREFKHLAEAALEAGPGSAAAETFKTFATPENILALVAEVERERSNRIHHHKRFLALAGDLARAGDKVLSDAPASATGESLQAIQAGVDTRNRVINELRTLLEDMTQQRDQALVDRMTTATSPRALNALCWIRQTTFAEDLKHGLRSITNDPALARDVSDAFRFTAHKDIMRFYEEYAYAPGNTQWQQALAAYISSRVASYDM